MPAHSATRVSSGRALRWSMSAHAHLPPPLARDPRDDVPGRPPEAAATRASTSRRRSRRCRCSARSRSTSASRSPRSCSRSAPARCSRSRSRSGTKHVIMWPASAMLTGNGVAFILRVPGTPHGDWWSLRGVVDLRRRPRRSSLLSKYVIKWRGEHVFNPSNIGLVALLPDPRARPRRAARLLVGADVVVARARARDHRDRRAS